MTSGDWWRGAVVYQIYPRSFLDTNGDGVGDLRGIAAKLDYITALGVDAIWLSPVYPSPNRDFGYDVSDYCGVDPSFGSMADFDRLLAGAHERGLKVILDQVLSHSSDQHPWFQESLLSRDNARADWYVWADAEEDGTPPNNWLAAFGGPAWSWHPVRRQYYHHKFLKQQPKLNFHNADVVAALMDVLRFWLDKGVDGFRLDVANSYLHDKTLADNPPVPVAERTGAHWAHAPHLQRHLHDANREENAWAMTAVRNVMNEYKDRFVFGEFSEEPAMLGRYASGPDKLHTGYTFDFVEDWSFAPRVFRDFYMQTRESAPDVWPCVTFSNHDFVRPVTRWGGGRGDDALARLLLLLLMTLKGTVLMYQGEELGLPDADLARDDIRDPVGDLYFPFHKGRDGCRTPMSWENAVHGGFSTVKPWLPVPDYHICRSVAGQESDPESVLACALKAIALRKAHPALVDGDIVFLDLPEPMLAFERMADSGRYLCLFNLGRETAKWEADALTASRHLLDVGSVALNGSSAELGPRAGIVLKTA